MLTELNDCALLCSLVNKIYTLLDIQSLDRKCIISLMDMFFVQVSAGMEPWHETLDKESDWMPESLIWDTVNVSVYINCIDDWEFLVYS